jgi:MFS family permease
VSFRVLFQKPYLERTLVSGVMNVCIAFEYTAIAFFLPSILAQFLGAGVFETISASLGLNALFAFTGGLLGMRLAWKFPSRHVAIAGFALQFIALISLALIGHPQATTGVVVAVLMLGLWLFAEGFGPGAQLMIYPALSYPTHIRATGVGFSRSLSGIGSALALFILPILQARYGTNMFWIVSLAALIPIIFLLIVRFEPTRQDIDEQPATGDDHV